MKSRNYLTLLIVAILGLCLPAFTTSCTTAPSARNAQVQTIGAIGDTADAAVALSAQLYATRSITADQARQVIDFYNLKFQPVYRVAVTAVKANLDSVASPDLIILCNQLTALVIQFQTQKAP